MKGIIQEQEHDDNSAGVRKCLGICVWAHHTPVSGHLATHAYGAPAGTISFVTTVDVRVVWLDGVQTTNEG